MVNIGLGQLLVPNFISLDFRVTAITLICAWLALWRHIGLFWLLSIAAFSGVLITMIPVG